MPSPSYATLTDLASHGLPAAALSGISNGDQQAALDVASALADGYIGAQFQLPLVPPYPLDLVQRVCVVAAYNLLARRGYNPESDNGVLLERNKEATRWFEHVAKGTVTPNFTDSQAGGTFAKHGGPFVVQATVSQGSSELGDTLTAGSVQVGASRLRGW